MILANKASVVSNRMINGLHYTELDNLWFLGKNVNKVLINIVLRAMKSRELLEVFEVRRSNRGLELINGAKTEPTLIAVGLNNSNLVTVSNGYLTNNWTVINWNSVGAVSFRGQVIWMHPDLTINLNLVNKNSSTTQKRPSNVVKLDSSDPYKNITDFKKWIETGKTLKVVEWNGKRNRRGMVLKVTNVLKTKGFYFEVYFGNRKIGQDFIEFLPATNYSFNKGGVVITYDSTTDDVMYVLEPVV